MDAIAKFETLDTSYVNLAALIQYLRARNFSGRLRVALDEYEADIFMYGSSAPSVWESNRASGLEAQGEAAMERLMVRAREPGGVITVYENSELKSALTIPLERPTTTVAAQAKPAKQEPSVESEGFDSLLLVTGDLLGAVERAVQSIGIEFADLFRVIRLELGDDYPFLDPTLGGFEYSGGIVTMRERPSSAVYTNAVTESLRRVVNKVAGGDKGARFRERAALELAIAARRHVNGLGEFASRLDQIAGTRVL